MTNPPEVIADWIAQCQASRRLSKWEVSFIESIAEQWEERPSLSDRQEEILERIYADKT